MKPNERALNNQLRSFENFADLAHQLGALRVLTTDARIGDDGSSVELFFSYGEFPDARFAYRAKAPGEDVHETLWLAEELATGALHRIMRDVDPKGDVA
ncbi:MAG: hypothetical protein HIU84_09770, partial [Acidobacteria bacterium]|nr:hypothetical protein [Acidobacteriota bacterium]